MRTVLVTGATGGLGLATARAAVRAGAHVLVGGRDPAAVRRTALELGAEPVDLDLARLDSVRDAVSRLPVVDVVACVAGVQVVRELQRTPDGLEATFQVNHLAHLVLLDELLARRTPPQRVALIGSATHDPARWTGMPPPLPDDVAMLARPPEDLGSPGESGRRRYTTSKLLAAATAAALAREHPGTHVTCFDPGLMPATGLAREYPRLARLLLRGLGPVIQLLPFAASPAASGEALARLLLEEPPPSPSGAYLDHRLTAVAASERARDTDFQDRLLRDSRALAATVAA